MTLRGFMFIWIWDKGRSCSERKYVRLIGLWWWGKFRNDASDEKTGKVEGDANVWRDGKVRMVWDLTLTFVQQHSLSSWCNDIHQILQMWTFQFTRPSFFRTSEEDAVGTMRCHGCFINIAHHSSSLVIRYLPLSSQMWIICSWFTGVSSLFSIFQNICMYSFASLAFRRLDVHPPQRVLSFWKECESSWGACLNIVLKRWRSIAMLYAMIKRLKQTVFYLRGF